MINFPRSTFTWKAHPMKPDPHYRYSGGFVGLPGQVYHVRFNLEASCEVRDVVSGQVAELFLGAPCRSEYTIATRNLFQIPSGEWRMAFSRERGLSLASRPSHEPEEASTTRLDEKYPEHRIDVRSFADVEELTEVGRIVEATSRSVLVRSFCPIWRPGTAAMSSGFSWLTWPSLSSTRWNSSCAGKSKRPRKKESGWTNRAAGIAWNCSIRIMPLPATRRSAPGQQCTTRSGNWRRPTWYCAPRMGRSYFYHHPTA